MIKRKNILIFVIIIIIILIIGRIIFFRQDYVSDLEKELSMTDFYKIHKANLIFGNDLCNKNENDHPSLGLTMISPYKCKICGKETQYSSSPTPIICESCSEVTNRCHWCGKLER